MLFESPIPNDMSELIIALEKLKLIINLIQKPFKIVEKHYIEQPEII